MISVLQATAWYPPGHMGGTEVYLSSLVRELRAFNVGSRIIAPLGPEAEDGYEFDGAVVRTYSLYPASSAEFLGGRPRPGLERFRQILAEERPDIYHQHSWSGDELGGGHLRVAHEAGFKTVLTVHTPTIICLRRTMLRFGHDPCDGLIKPARCGACWSNQRGAPKIIARSLGAIAPTISSTLERSMPPGRLARALSARAFGERQKREFAQAVTDTDRIIAISEWMLETLVLNGVPADKLILLRQGIETEFADEATRVASLKGELNGREFRLLYLGRWHPDKGIDVLIKAVRTLPEELPLKLVIHGLGNSAEGCDYAATMRRLAAGDPRIAFEPPIARPQLAAALACASAVAVPSTWMEMAPLVVLEAKAAGLPVIGSRIGGIAEFVREPEEGCLVPPGDVLALAQAISAMVSRRAAQPPTGPVGRVRTMREVAGQMAAIYTSLC
jgi:glycosyltransferase involved in cell wall biosynthesis